MIRKRSLQIFTHYFLPVTHESVNEYINRIGNEIQNWKWQDGNQINERQ